MRKWYGGGYAELCGNVFGGSCVGSDAVMGSSRFGCSIDASEGLLLSPGPMCVNLEGGRPMVSGFSGLYPVASGVDRLPRTSRCVLVSGPPAGTGFPV